MVYKVNYTISADAGDINFMNFFYARDTEEIHDSIMQVMEDHGVGIPDIFIDNCAIYGTGTEYDVTITIEQVQIFDDVALKSIMGEV